MPLDKKSNKQIVLLWASIITLALCVDYALYSLASSIALFSLVDKIVFGSLGIAVWGIGVFFLLVRMGHNLELHLVRGAYENALAVGLLATVTALAVSVVLVILGFVGIVAIAPISLVVLSLSLLFSSEFFGMKLVPFSFRLVCVAFVIGLIIAAAGFLA